MTLYRETEDGFVPWDGKAVGNLLPPADIESKWTLDEIEALGLFVPVESETPDGMQIASASVERVDGVVKFVYVFEPAALPDLTMRQLRLGLLSAGRPVGFIQDVIDAIPGAMDRAIATIWYEETSIVAWQHPMTQTLMAAAGISEAEGKAMWMAASQIPA